MQRASSVRHQFGQSSTALSHHVNFDLTWSDALRILVITALHNRLQGADIAVVPSAVARNHRSEVASRVE